MNIVRVVRDAEQGCITGVKIIGMETEKNMDIEVETKHYIIYIDNKE